MTSEVKYTPHYSLLEKSREEALEVAKQQDPYGAAILGQLQSINSRLLTGNDIKILVQEGLDPVLVSMNYRLRSIESLLEGLRRDLKPKRRTKSARAKTKKGKKK